MVIDTAGERPESHVVSSGSGILIWYEVGEWRNGNQPMGSLIV